MNSYPHAVNGKSHRWSRLCRLSKTYKSHLFQCATHLKESNHFYCQINHMHLHWANWWTNATAVESGTRNHNISNFFFTAYFFFVQLTGFVSLRLQHVSCNKRQNSDRVQSFLCVLDCDSGLISPLPALTVGKGQHADPVRTADCSCATSC